MILLSVLSWTDETCQRATETCVTEVRITYFICPVVLHA